MVVESAISEDETTLVISIKGNFKYSMLDSFRASYDGISNVPENVIVDLKGADAIDSSALGMLLNMQRFLNKEDGGIKIINANDAIMKVFQITHFDRKFEIK